ncbi:MAG: shikimate kinase [Flavobacteriales bacterium]|nr:shikimate kinase [Flavobacteriales bacterium]
MKVFLVGYMGSGKSTLGPKLGLELSLPFLDLDKEIEKKEGKSIALIFEEENGTDRFREVERDMLDESISNLENFVMATGGGAPCFYEGIEKMLNAGLVVYLQLPAKTLVQRILQSKEKRPVVAKIPDDRLLDHIAMQLRGRELEYNCANIIADGLKITPKTLAHQIREFKMANL